MTGLIIARHGPEAMEVCYERSVPMDETTLRHAPVHCPECGYNLRGLAGVGRCPECSSDYDKADIIADF